MSDYMDKYYDRKLGKYWRKNPWWAEFVEIYEGDPSVGIPRGDAEEVRELLLKDATKKKDKDYILKAYKRMKKHEASERKSERQIYEEYKRSMR